jgi:omega-hydroxy-beta-dihydromenaquinone-9 sulfotransferase
LFSVPQEDELATNVLAGGISPYLATCFLRSWRSRSHLLRFATAGCQGQLSQWRSALLYFCRKVQYRVGPRKRLLLKSPVHTARIALLLSIFPEAQFVYVHRHPEEVFQSSVRLVDSYFRAYSTLQKFNARDAQDYIFGQGVEIHEAYMKDSETLRPNHFVEIAFADLIKDPVEAMRRVYNQLELPAFDCALPQLERHVDAAANFRRNDHKPLTPEAVLLIRRVWKRWYEDFGYN